MFCWFSLKPRCKGWPQQRRSICHTRWQSLLRTIRFWSNGVPHSLCVNKYKVQEVSKATAERVPRLSVRIGHFSLSVYLLQENPRMARPQFGPSALERRPKANQARPFVLGGLHVSHGETWVSREQRRWLNRSDSLFWRGAPVDDQGARGKALKHLNQVENADAAGRRLPQAPGVQTSRPPETSRGPIRSTNKKGACCFFSRVRSRLEDSSNPLLAGSFGSLCSRFDCSVVPSGHPFGVFRLGAQTGRCGLQAKVITRQRHAHFLRNCSSGAFTAQRCRQSRASYGWPISLGGLLRPYQRYRADMSR